ncbi:hypothetical protein A8713_20455 [Streptomyces sp. SAT1]|nr:hypothetical protein A8713_20455 [Streptomyces sp. SAT1]
MTSSPARGVLPRRAIPHRCVRAARAVLGGTAGLMWLALPVMTINNGTAVAAAPRSGPGPAAAPTAAAAAPGQDETSGADLVLPLAAVGAVAVGAGYGYVRRTRRARTRTTPGGGHDEPAEARGLDEPLETEERARRSLVMADDCVRTSREELAFAEARFGGAAVAPFAAAVREAGTELAAAFAVRLVSGDRTAPTAPTAPTDPDGLRQARAGVIGRCEEAGRVLDAAAGDFDALRGLDRGVGGAVRVAETRFRALTGRTAAAESVLAGLARRYAPSASDQVTGHAEQARDRLMFATVHLNQARQSADRDERDAAIAHLRAAEGAVAQAAVFLDGIERLAAALDEAAALVPAALSGAEAERAAARTGPADVPADVPAGETRSRVLHLDGVLASVRQELASGRPYGPLDALRRIVAAATPLGTGRTGVLSAAALLVARSTVAGAADFVTTHRGAVGPEARTALAEAERLLAVSGATADLLSADTLARAARERAEQDVRVHGNPCADADVDAIGSPTGGPGFSGTPGAAGAVLGGILLGPSPTAPPASFGGPRTRARHVGGRSS